MNESPIIDATVHTPGILERIRPIHLIAALMPFTLTFFTALIVTESIKIAAGVAGFLTLLVGTFVLIVATVRMLQRSDNLEGRQDVAATLQPLMQVVMESMKAEREQKERLMQHILDNQRAADPLPRHERETPKALPVPEPDEPVVRSAPIMTGSVPDFFGPADLRVKNMADEDGVLRFEGVHTPTGGRWSGFYSVELIASFVETQWPDVGRDNWRHDTHAYGWTANLFVLLGYLIPFGNSWRWHRSFSKGDLDGWIRQLQAQVENVSRQTFSDDT